MWDIMQFWSRGSRVVQCGRTDINRIIVAFRSSANTTDKHRPSRTTDDIECDLGIQRDNLQEPLRCER